MGRFRQAWIAGAGALLLVPAAWPQEAQEKPLGDVAREQRDARKPENAPQKVYRNDDLAPAPEAKDTPAQDTVAVVAGSEPDSKAQDSAASANPLESGSNEKSQDATEDARPPAPAKPASQPDKPSSQADKTARPVADRVKDKAPDFYIVPAGTEIKVDISEENQQRDLEHIVQGKVVAPVRLGFATPIPALSKATVQLSMRYYDTGGDEPQAAYNYVAQLTSVTVDGTSYDVESSEIPVGPMPGMTSEVSFTLQRALAIKR